MSAASAPASSANLGPGFDVVAIALDLRCRVTVADSGRWSMTSDAGEMDDDADRFVRAAAEAAVPGIGPLAVQIEGDIPLARGLGSSAALIVAVVGAVRALAGGSTDRSEVCTVATGIEGHPDNVAAAAHGGAVMVSPSGFVHALEVHPSITPVVAVPEHRLLTQEAREAVRQPVPVDVSSRTAARLAFLIEGLRTADAGVLAEAAGDELHESRRAALSPLTVDLIEAARSAGALHAAWSGAGPSVIALVNEDVGGAVSAALEERLGDAGTVMQPRVDRSGLEVSAG